MFIKMTNTKKQFLHYLTQKYDLLNYNFKEAISILMSNDGIAIDDYNTFIKTRENLEKVKDKLNSIYPTSLKVWEDNWEAICTLFNYSKELRRIMYTTNAIESLNRSYRKYTKTKGVFTSDNSLMKCLFLATKNVEKKWTTRYPNWDMIYNELNILYPERLN